MRQARSSEVSVARGDPSSAASHLGQLQLSAKLFGSFGTHAPFTCAKQSSQYHAGHESQPIQLHGFRSSALHRAHVSMLVTGGEGGALCDW